MELPAKPEPRAAIAGQAPSLRPVALPLLSILLVAGGCVRGGFDIPLDAGPDVAPWAFSGDASSDALALAGPSVLLAPGIFVMGSPASSEPCRGDNESPRQVRLTHPFEIAVTEVTRAQFREVMDYDPSAFAACPDCPVNRLTWHQAASYCNALSRLAELPECYACNVVEGRVYCAPARTEQPIYECPGLRLPTEAEWEYAYRAGTQTSLYNGDVAVCDDADTLADAIAWYGHNADGSPHPVAGKTANAWGLFDMAGNVWEWCHDWYEDDLGSGPVDDPCGVSSGTARTLRGGGWGASPGRLRAAHRGFWPPENTESYFGFRWVRTVQ